MRIFLKINLQFKKIKIIPQFKNKVLTTVEGVFDRIISNLESDIVLKKELDKSLTDKLEIFVGKLKDLKSLKNGPFEIVEFFLF